MEHHPHSLPDVRLDITADTSESNNHPTPTTEQQPPFTKEVLQDTQQELTEQLQALQDQLNQAITNGDTQSFPELSKQIQTLSAQLTQLETGIDVHKRVQEVLRTHAEQLRSQAETGFQAVTTVIETLNTYRAAHGIEQIPPISKETYDHAFEAKLQEWASNGTLEWVANRFETHNERYSLVATPNILADSQQLFGLADEFARGQGFGEAYKDTEHFELYSPEQLSGALAPDQLVRFTLIPDQYTSELGRNIVATQLELLADMQATNPNLSIAIPSVLEAECYWQARVAAGDSLKDNTAWDRTYIRHIDLPAHTFEGYSVVLCSNVRNGGKPRMTGSVATSRNDARVLVR